MDSDSENTYQTGISYVLARDHLTYFVGVEAIQYMLAEKKMGGWGTNSG
jgi:hypothetical protein